MAFFEQDSEAMIALEAMVDKVGTRNVLYALANIAGAKAEHLRSNWQDEGTAQQWDRVAKALDKYAPRCPTSPLD